MTRVNNLGELKQRLTEVWSGMQQLLNICCYRIK